MGVTAGLLFRFGTGPISVGTPFRELSFASPGLFSFPLFPMACAMGCILPPLCGLEPLPSDADSRGTHAALCLGQIVKDLHYPIDNAYWYRLSTQRRAVNEKAC
jgi:hypothetical protein